MNNILINGFLRDNRLPSGKIVDLQGLLGHRMWSNFSDTEKRTLGKKFFKSVSSGEINCVAFDHINAARHAYYIVK